MDDPIGVLTLRVWREGNEGLRARTETKLDIEDRSPPIARHHATKESVLQEVADWLTAYEARAPRPTEGGRGTTVTGLPPGAAERGN